MDDIIQLTKVCLAYGSRLVLRDIDLQVKPGQFWFVLGPNGEGKTTLLRALLGLLPPSAGTVRWREHDRRHERTGFVPQRCDLNPSLPTTVREFVLLGLTGRRLRRAERPDRLRRALQQVDLHLLEESDYWSLSGGQRQRALLARALVRQPELLILDEPTNGLDLSAEHELLCSLARLNREEQLTIVLVTHDLPLAARYASHLALVHGGRVESGPLATLLSAPSLQRCYGVPVELRREPSGSYSVTLPGNEP